MTLSPKTSTASTITNVAQQADLSLSAENFPAPQVLLTGDTKSRRLFPAQQAFATYLASKVGTDGTANGGLGPVIVDVGVGDGAVTIHTDLVDALRMAGHTRATIIGVDASQYRVLAATKIGATSHSLLATEGAYKFEVRLGDILHPEASPHSLKSIMNSLRSTLSPDNTWDGTADLVLSSNLIPVLPEHLRRIAVERLGAIAKGDGLIGLGEGEARSAASADLSFTLYGASDLANPKLVQHWGADYFSLRNEHSQSTYTQRSADEMTAALVGKDQRL